MRHQQTRGGVALAGVVAAVVVAAGVVGAAGCTAGPAGPGPAGDRTSAATTASMPAPSAPAASPSTAPSRTDGGQQPSGARAEVPATVIMAQLARRAERVAKRIPLEQPTQVDVDPGTNRALGYQLLVEFGFPADQWKYLDALWLRESGWDHLAENPSSGAYGIPQSLPAEKMAVVGRDWRTNPETQISWGLAYIAARYGNPQRAWEHSERRGWY
ncbi:lytic transglycosylase domain-containing protein [Nocardioides sp. SYSU DS0651]|uniref:aggregation-promoting factor C-terminal-like domain-containing protein n=1 Tax=Nocardioides sp. SYSU DS0651 TaxID=3415955 RepID=UPI003F4AFBD6